MNVDTRPPIRSAWPTPIGKPLSTRKINEYIKKGYYKTNLDARQEKRQRSMIMARLKEDIRQFV